MNILFIHQNFPGQYKHLAPALARAGHKCVALTLRVESRSNGRGFSFCPIRSGAIRGRGYIRGLLISRPSYCAGNPVILRRRELKAQGFQPDLIVAHPGWGESMFLRDLWPEARIGLYYELYYAAREGRSWV